MGTGRSGSGSMVSQCRYPWGYPKLVGCAKESQGMSTHMHADTTVGIHACAHVLVILVAQWWWWWYGGGSGAAVVVVQQRWWYSGIVVTV